MPDRWIPNELKFSGHALKQMFARGISPADAREVVENGEAIKEYPEDKPFPSRLLFAYVGGRPIHVVLAYDAATGTGHVVTAYSPDPGLWQRDFRARNKP